MFYYEIFYYDIFYYLLRSSSVVISSVQQLIFLFASEHAKRTWGSCIPSVSIFTFPEHLFFSYNPTEATMSVRNIMLLTT